MLMQPRISKRTKTGITNRIIFLKARYSPSRNHSGQSDTFTATVYFIPANIKLKFDIFLIPQIRRTQQTTI